MCIVQVRKCFSEFLTTEDFSRLDPIMRLSVTPAWKLFCRITMQPPLFELKLKTIRLLHRRDHFVFKRKFLKVSTLCKRR